MAYTDSNENRLHFSRLVFDELCGLVSVAEINARGAGVSRDCAGISDACGTKLGVVARGDEKFYSLV